MSNCHSVLCLCGALLISEKSGKRMKHIVFRYKTRCILQNKVSPDSPQDLFGRGRCSVDPDEWCKCFPAPAFPWEQTSSSSSAGEAGGCGLRIDNLITHRRLCPPSVRGEQMFTRENIFIIFHVKLLFCH